MLLRLFAEESGFSAKLVGETEKDERHSFLNLSHLLCHMAPLQVIVAPFFASYLFQEIFHLALPHCSLFCLVTEMTEVFESTESMMTVYLVFHLVGVSSCCTNPILYGFLNDNFQKVSPSHIHKKHVQIYERA